jgi:hypothetical protein
LETIDDLSRADQVQLLAGEFLQIKIIGAQAGDSFAQRCIVFLHPIILLVEPGLFTLQPPEMYGAALTNHGME